MSRHDSFPSTRRRRSQDALRAVLAVVILALAHPSAAQAPPEEIVPGTDVVTYYDQDAVGSVRMITDAAGVVVARYDYLPFGTPWNPSAYPSNRLFTGAEHDASTGLDYMGTRYFEDQIGRFTQPDFSMAEHNPFDPQGWSLYPYARNNPLRWVDPSGRESECTPSESNVCVTAPSPSDPDLEGWQRGRWASFTTWSGALDTVHTGLDVAGLFPGVGELADLTNAGVYLLQGDKFNFAISMAGMAILGGQVATGSRLARKGLLTPEKYFGRKSAEEIREALAQKFGLPRSVRANAETFYNSITKRSFNVHTDPVHGPPHVDIRRRGGYPERQFYLRSTP